MRNSNKSAALIAENFQLISVKWHFDNKKKMLRHLVQRLSHKTEKWNNGNLILVLQNETVACLHDNFSLFIGKTVPKTLTIRDCQPT